MKKIPTTASAFKKECERAFRSANPDAKDAIIKWTYGPAFVTWFDKSKGFSGQFMASATGYRSKTMFCSTGSWGLEVR
jgi:hypothetical protein